MTDQLHLPTGTYFRREIDGPRRERERHQSPRTLRIQPPRLYPKWRAIDAAGTSRGHPNVPTTVLHVLGHAQFVVIDTHTVSFLLFVPSSSPYRYQLDYAELCKRSAALTGYSIPTEDNRLYKNGGNGKGSRAASIEK